MNAVKTPKQPVDSSDTPLDLVADPDNNFVLIMKDGKIYKNSVQ